MRVFILLTLIFILGPQSILARTGGTPLQSYRANLIMEEFFRNFDDKEINQARVKFAKDISGIDLTLKQSKEIFSKIKYYSNSECLVCISIADQKLSFNISSDKKQLFFGVNKKIKTFNLNEFTIKDINDFFKQSVKRTSSTPRC